MCKSIPLILITFFLPMIYFNKNITIFVGLTNIENAKRTCVADMDIVINGGTAGHR
jgi:hypothetical protein